MVPPMPAAPPQPSAPTPLRGLPRAFVAVCVAVGVFAGAYAILTLLSVATASTEHVQRSFRAVGEVHVTVGSGDVEVIGEARDDVLVDAAIQRGMWRGAWQPETELRRDGVRLDATSGCSLWAHIGVSDCGASFTVRVPRGTRVVIEAKSGDVRVMRIDGIVTVGVSSGDVHADDAGGPLAIETSSGDVSVEGYLGRRLSVETSSGDVALRTVSAPRRVRARASSGDVDVRVPDVPYRVSVQTGSGDEDVQVRRDADAPRSIEATTGSGDVTIVGAGDPR